MTSTSSDATPDKAVACFNKLPSDDRILIQFLSVLYAPVAKQVLLNCTKRNLLWLPHLPGRNRILDETLERLGKLKLVRVARDGVRCIPGLMHAATLSAVNEGSFALMAAAAQTEIPMVSDWGSSYYRSPQHALRDVRIGFYRKDAKAVSEATARFVKQFPFEAARCHPWVQVCNAPFDPQWLRTLPEPLAVPALREILSHTFATLDGAEAPFQMLCELAATPPLPPGLPGIYCTELALRGRLSEAERAAGGEPQGSVLGLMGWSALQRGEFQESVSRFEAALVLLKKESGKRNAFFEDLLGPLYILALIGSGDAKMMERATQRCAYVVGRKEWPYQEVYRLLQLVLSQRNGEAPLAEKLDNLIYYLDDAHLVTLFLGLALHWCGVEVPEKATDLLTRVAEKARRAGYLWLADELVLTASACGKETETATEAAQRYREQGLIPLYRLLQRSEPWEHALDALMRLNSTDPPAAAKEGPQSRLIWHFQDHGRYVELQPREQKLSPTGKWSAGRNIALKRLVEAKELDFLSEQDRQVCGCIKLERESGYGYYSRENYHIDLNRALPLLVGHPHLYLDPSGSVQLELLQGEPELQLNSQGDTLLMTLYPPFEQEQKIFLAKESPTRIRIFEAREEYRKIASIVGAGLKIPAAAKEKALAAINALSSILVVHSDLGGAGEAIPGDATPLFHLLPYNEGVKLELYVRPFSETGPYLRPGAGGETVMAELEGKRVQARRDLRLECRRAEDALAFLELPEEDEGSQWEWLVPGTQQALELILQLQALGDAVRVAWPEGARFKVTHQAGTSHLKLAIRKAREWFEMEGELRLNEGLALNLQQLLSLMKEGGGRFVPLGEGEFLALSAEFRKKLEELAAFTDPHGAALRFHPLASGAFEDLVHEAGEVNADRHWEERLLKLREAYAVVPVLPATLQAELRPYQEEGFAWLNRLSRWGVGACLADDMGLGKTVQTLAQLLTMAERGPSLVVAPTSVCANWESEAARFAPTLNAVIYGGGNRKELLDGLKPFDLLICSYGLLQQDGELLAAVQWQGVVLDEAQAIKNMATKRSQAAMQLEGAFRMVATGTPIENHLGELWNVFRFINPGLLGSLKQFNYKFASPIEKTQDKKARTRLKKLIQPFILRRTKSQVLEELPPRTEITLKVEMSEEEASLYEALRRNALENLSGLTAVEGKKDNHIKILAEIMRLRRACCNPRLVLPDSGMASCKLAAFGEILEELRENRHKALVFSQFVDHLSIIRGYLDRSGVRYQYLDGSTSPPERKKRVEAFQSGEGDLFLISLKAGGVGLNLTAADYVIHMDPWWNPAVEDQASDRAHRMGQKRPVTVYRLVTKGTIEEKIVALHQQKRGLADTLLDESDLSGKVSAEELLALLRTS